MSIRVMTLVWDKYRGAGSELLAMLALADWCSDDGGSLHPSIAALAEKMRVSESQARRTLHKLIDDGFVSVVGRANGGRPGATRQYRIDVARLSAEPVNPVPVSPQTEVSTTGMDATPSVSATPRMDATPESGETGSTDATPSMDARAGMDASRQVAPMRETGSTHDTRTVIEPSVNRQSLSSGGPDGMPAGFAEFWSTWPRSPRKEKKAECLKRWKARELEKETAAIVAGVVAKKATKKWLDGYEPAPLTFLNAREWLDNVQDQMPAIESNSVEDNRHPDPRFRGAV